MSDSVFFVGEELVYNVSYAFLDIGQIKIKVVEKQFQGDLTVYKAVANIDSYKGVPFVDLHAVFQSKIERSFYPVWFQSRTKGNSHWHTITYSFDYDNKLLYYEENNTSLGNSVKQDSFVLDKMYQEGLSLLFFARKNLSSKKTLNTPILINGKKGNTVFFFNNERTNIKIESIKYPVDVLYFSGQAQFVGLYGMTGEFEGWFSNDEARIPILAKMRVLLGNIRIELMKWARDGWVPPRAQAIK